MIAEYKCCKCCARFEVILGHDDPEPTHCKCGGDVEKLFPTGVSVKYKGVGFHAVDYGVRERQRSGRRFGNVKAAEEAIKIAEQDKAIEDAGGKVR